MAVLLPVAGIALSLLVAHEPRHDDRRRARGARRRRRRGRAHGAGELANTGEAFAQVLTPDGDGDRHDDRRRRRGRCSTRRRCASARATAIVIVERSAQDGARLRLLARPVRGGRRARRSWSWASRSPSASARSTRCTRCCSIGGPLALLIASAVGYALAAAALRPVERMRRHAAAVTAARDERAAAGPARQRRDRAARAHAERDAGPARGRVQARAGVRLGRLARAAHAARDPAHGARAGAARRAHARGARGRAALGRRGVRAALASSPRTCS